jgi:hypothetical protein
MTFNPNSLLALTALTGVLALAGCGGSNPTTETPTPQIPEQLTYPAYHATGPQGEQLYLLLKKDGQTLKGEFVYFIPTEGQEAPDIMSGPANGTVGNDGTVHLTLTNPYNAEVPPIVTEGVQTEAGWRLHDVETPEDVVEFTPVEEPTVTRGVLGNDANLHVNELDQDIYIEHNVIPLSLIPLTYWANVRTDKSTILTDYDGRHGQFTSAWVCSFIQTGISWIDIYRGNTHTARVWAWGLPKDLDQINRPLLSDSSLRAPNGTWVKMTGTLGPKKPNQHL